MIISKKKTQVSSPYEDKEDDPVFFVVRLKNNRHRVLSVSNINEITLMGKELGSRI